MCTEEVTEEIEALTAILEEGFLKFLIYKGDYARARSWAVLAPSWHETQVFSALNVSIVY